MVECLPNIFDKIQIYIKLSDKITVDHAKESNEKKENIYKFEVHNHGKKSIENGLKFK